MSTIFKTVCILGVSMFSITFLALSQTLHKKIAASVINGNAKSKWQKNITRLSGQHLNHTSAAGNTARTTGPLAERLVGVSDYDYYAFDTLVGGRLGFNDSTVFRYSAGRGSSFDFNQMFFDPAFYFGGYIIPGFVSYIGFNNHNNQSSILFDNAWTWGYGLFPLYPTDTLGLLDTQYVYYDSNYNVTDWVDLQQMDTTSVYNDDRYLNTYDSHSNLITSYTLSWYYSVWDTSEFEKFTYDPSGSVIQDSTFIYLGGGIWQPYERWVYTFDDSGNMVHADYYNDSSGVWQYTEQYFMRYNSSNRLTWDSVAQFTGGWVAQESDSLAYTPGLAYIIYQKTSIFDTGTFVSYLFRTKHITAGLPDTFYVSEINYDSTIIDQYKAAYIYDSYSEPVIVATYIFNLDTTYLSGSFSASPDYITHYYYETYEPRHPGTSGISQTTNTDDINVYPNPTTDQIYISKTGVTTSTNSSVQLINTSGQVVLFKNILWQGQTTMLSLSGFMPGVYWISIRDIGTGNIYKQEIIKE